MKKALTLLILICSSCALFAQHNSDYVQYLFNGLLLNPAYAGSREALDITGLYRKQWIGMNATPETVSFSAHSPIGSRKINLGFIALNDRYGVFNHTKLNLIYAYRMRLFNGGLSLGLQGGFDTYTSNWNQLHTTDANDPNFEQSMQRSTVPNAGFGAYYSSDQFAFGAACPDLLNGYVDKYRTIMIHSAGLIDLSESMKLKPALLFKYIFNSPVSANLSGTFYWKDVIGLGVGYTFNTSAIAYMDLRINDQLRIGYGYDHNLTRLKTYSGGSHEFMLRYLFRYKIDPVSARYF